MTTNTNGVKMGLLGAGTLVVAHMIGMIDLVALPVWVGALQGQFGFSLQQAGGLATLFLLGAVLASVVLATRLNGLDRKMVAVLGFGAAAAVFFAASLRSDFGSLAALHALAGVAVGAGLSMVHGAIGRAENPHRLFATAGIALGLFAILFLAIAPQILIAQGGPALFVIFAAVMAVAALAALIGFPSIPPAPEAVASAPFSRAVWLVIIGISLMTFNQAMVFSFVEVIGSGRGFAKEQVLGVLIALGLINFILAAPLAAILEKRLSAFSVVQAGPIVQAVLAVAVTSIAVFAAWAFAASIFVAVQIFTHTFGFGLLARLDASGRAVAATPAMLMIGSALGPFVGGALSQNLGFGTLGAAAVVVGLAATLSFRSAKAAA